MKRALIKWWYRRRYERAKKYFEGMRQRHYDAGHEVYFNVSDSGNQFSYFCYNCPELQPLRRRPEDVEHITIDSTGRPYRG